MTFLRLHWRLSSSLAVDREAAIMPEGSVSRLFSEASSSADRCLLFPTSSLSLDLKGATPTYYCARAGGVNGTGLHG